jgi:hypothetical protein
MGDAQAVAFAGARRQRTERNRGVRESRVRRAARDADSQRSLGELFCPAIARLVEPAVAAIAAELDGRQLQLTSIEEPDVRIEASRAQRTDAPMPRYPTLH